MTRRCVNNCAWAAQAEGGASVETFGSLLSVLEEQSFTGRDRELQRFLTWLQERRALPSLLNVIGPGGVGKTTLLRAFGRQAKRLGQPVMVVDGHDLEATPLAFLSALGTIAIEPAPAMRPPPGPRRPPPRVSPGAPRSPST